MRPLPISQIRKTKWEFDDLDDQSRARMDSGNAPFNDQRRFTGTSVFPQNKLNK